MFYLAQEGKSLERKVFWLSAPNLKDIPYKIDSSEPWTGLMLKMFCPRVHKTVASFVQKMGLIWRKGCILLQSVFQDAKVIVNRWDKLDDSVMCTGKKNDVATYIYELLLTLSGPAFSVVRPARGGAQKHGCQKSRLTSTD